MNAEKVKQYNELVADVKEYLVKVGDPIVENPYFAEKFNEVNLWSIWQGGREALDAKILVVGQDWGEVTTDNAKAFIEKIMTAPNPQEAYMDTIIGGKFVTDELLNNCLKCFGYDVIDKESIKICRNIAFTNLGLRYRKDKSSGSGGDYSDKWLTEGVPFLQRYIDIVKPVLVVCLGRSVFDRLLKAYDADMSKQIKGKKYNDLIEDAMLDEFIVRTATGNKFALVPMAHPGYFGQKNRVAKGEDGKSTIINDWRSLARQYPDIVEQIS